MLRTIISRLIQGIVVVFCLLLITFMLVRLMPGDPFSGDKAHAPHIIQKNKERFHLDKSNSEQFVVYLGLLARGDLGADLLWAWHVGVLERGGEALVGIA